MMFSALEVLPVFSEEGFSTFSFGPFYQLLIIGTSIKIVLALVANFPTNLVSSNSKSVCRSCVSFGVLKKVAVVLPLTGAVLPLGGDAIFYYRSWERYYRGYYSSSTAPDQKLVTSPAVVGDNPQV